MRVSKRRGMAQREGYFRQVVANSLPATPLAGVVPAFVRYRSAQAREPRGQAPVAGRPFPPDRLTLKPQPSTPPIDNRPCTRQHVPLRSRFARSFSDPTSLTECLAPHGGGDSGSYPPQFSVNFHSFVSLVSLGIRVFLGGQFRSSRVHASGRSGRRSGVWKEYAGSGTGPADAGGHSGCGSGGA